MSKSIAKFTSYILIILFMLGICTVAPTTAFSYTNSKGSVKVVCGSYHHKFSAKSYGNNFSRALSNALAIAGRKASAKKRATVTIAKGSYKIDRTIYIYSNTTLIATGSKFIRRDNILSNGYKNFAYSAQKYKGAENIKVKGGTWDISVPYSQANTKNTSIMHSTFRFAHCKNITIQNCTFKNNYNCHDIEMGGVDGATVTHCTFSNDKNVNSFVSDGGKEAIQIDLNTKEAVPYFPSYDYTTCKNITISYNTFKNKYRAIGSHHAMVGTTYDNIKVHHNKFSNIAGFTVYAVYWTNSKIYSNTFTDVGAGIDVRPMIIGDSMNFYNYKKLGYSASEFASRYSKMYIYDNKINIREKNNKYDYCFGIRVMGASVPKNQSKTGIKKGDYYSYNVNVGCNSKGTSKPNKITGNLYCGIYMSYAKKSKICNNTVDLSFSDKKYSYGVVVRGCENTTVNNNTVKEGGQGSSQGILIGETAEAVPSADTTVTNNKVKNFVYSCATVSNSYNTKLENNTFSSAKYGVVIKAGTHTTLNKNTIKGALTNGVYSSNGSNGTVVTNNNINSSSYGFYLNDSKDIYTDEEKTLDINNNTISKGATTASVSLQCANLVARIYDNVNQSGIKASTRFKGTEADSFIYKKNDFSVSKCSMANDNGNSNLTWNSNSSATGYRVYRTLFDDKETLADLTKTTFTDTTIGESITDSTLSYSVAPYVNSSNIKLLGAETTIK